MVTPEWKKTDGRLAARCAAVASFGAGVIHLAVAPMHWRDWVLAGLFFAVIAVFQLVWTYFAWSRPTVLVLGIGIAVNVGLVALWVSSHTAGAPFGPFAGRPESVDAAGISVQLLQCYVIMGAAWAWFRGYRAEEVSGFNRALVLIGANTVMVGAVVAGVASTVQGHDHHRHGGPAQMQAEHHTGSIPKPATGSPDRGLPVTDMGLETGAPMDAVPSAAPAPADPSLADPSAVAPEPADGHQHQHD